MSSPHADPESARYPFLDRIKVAFIVMIIVMHAWLGYSTLEDAWTYQGRRETTFGEASAAVIMPVVLLGLLFAMAAFFFMAGLLAPRSLDRRGPGRYAVDRLLRLGVPFVLWVLVIWPITVWSMDQIIGYSYRSLWESFTQAEPFPDTGPMWFIEILLIFSLAYAGMVALRQRSPASSVPASPGKTITPALLIVLAVTVAVTTFAVRLVFGLNSTQYAHLNVWQWPAYIALFWLGIAGCRQGWLTSIPRNVVRTAGVLAGVGLALASGLVVLLGSEAISIEDLAGGMTPIAATVALTEGLLSVGASAWLVALAQRHANAPPGGLQRAMARSAYGAFVLQGIVLIALALLVRPLPIVAEGKAAFVAVAGVAGSFSLAWLLVRKTPLGRVL